jgi:hypothetical protein
MWIYRESCFCVIPSPVGVLEWMYQSTPDLVSWTRSDDVASQQGRNLLQKSGRGLSVYERLIDLRVLLQYGRFRFRVYRVSSRVLV